MEVCMPGPDIAECLLFDGRLQGADHQVCHLTWQQAGRHQMHVTCCQLCEATTSTLATNCLLIDCWSSESCQAGRAARYCFSSSLGIEGVSLQK
jgi:hypothetical protein